MSKFEDKCFLSNECKSLTSLKENDFDDGSFYLQDAIADVITSFFFKFLSMYFISLINYY